MKNVSSFKIISLVLMVLSWPAMAGTIRGTVRDSVTGKPIGAAKVQTSVCSTLTDAAGNYTLTILATEIFPLAPPPQTRIFYEQSDNLFYWNGKKILLFNMRGESMSGKLSVGQYAGKVAGYSGVFKVLNIARERLFVLWGENTIKKKSPAKTTAGYKVSVSAPNYSPASQVANLGQNVDFKLTPLPANGNVEINLDSAGTIKIIPIFSN